MLMGVALTNREACPAITAPDGSEVRELARPPQLARNQSLAEATVAAGEETREHVHRITEEIYYFTSGSGRMRLGRDLLEVGVGDVVVIPPDTRHKLFNPGPAPLVLLCCCSPPYTDEDTELCD